MIRVAVRALLIAELSRVGKEEERQKNTRVELGRRKIHSLDYENQLDFTNLSLTISLDQRTTSLISFLITNSVLNPRKVVFLFILNRNPNWSRKQTQARIRDAVDRSAQVGRPVRTTKSGKSITGFSGRPQCHHRSTDLSPETQLGSVHDAVDRRDHAGRPDRVQL